MACLGRAHDLAQPYGLHISVPLLKIDPFWDPLRGDPRFRKLLLEYAHSDAAPADAGTGRGVH